jgi:hypothetical protein
MVTALAVFSGAALAAPPVSSVPERTAASRADTFISGCAAGISSTVVRTPLTSSASGE